MTKFLNVTIAHRSTVRRQHARMIITWTMDAAVNAGKIGRHKLAGITLTEGSAVPRRRQPTDGDEESGTGFVFITDAQVRTMAGAWPVQAGHRPQPGALRKAGKTCAGSAGTPAVGLRHGCPETEGRGAGRCPGMLDRRDVGGL
jgi:hypothetical protein